MDVPKGLSVADSLVSTVFENLPHNAVEHDDAATSSVTVAAPPVGDNVRVRIHDDVPGTEDGPDAVEPRDTGSRGVDLHLVRTLVARYDGDLTVDSDDEGTTVEVALPAAPTDAPRQSPPTAD